MTRIKTIIMSALVAAMASTIPASAASPYRGEKSMGIYAGYATRNESATAGIYFQYRFARCFRIAPSAGYDFRHKGEDVMTIDLDFHTPFALNQAGSVNIYPIAGVGYSSFNRRDIDHPERSSTDSRHRYDRLGINLGGGLEYFASPTLRLALEGKWRGRTDYSTGIIALSIGYRF